MPSVADMVAEVDANISPFKKGMEEAAKVADTNSSKISDALERIDDAIDTVTQGVRILGVSLSAFGLAKGAFEIFKSTLDRLSSIGDTADAIGATTQSFQELLHAAARAGVSQKDFSKDSQTFAQRAFEASKGVGKLHDELEKYNPAALDAINETGDFGGKLRELAEAVKAAGTEQQRTAIITAAFGESNAQLRRMLIGGAEGFDIAAEHARALGVVMDDELVRRAPEVREKFAALSDLIAVELQSALVTAAPSIVALAESLASLIPVVLPLIDGFNQLTNSISAAFSSNDIGVNSLGVLNVKLRETDMEIAKVTERLNSIGADDPARGTKAERFVMQRLAELQQLRGEIEAEIAGRGWRGQVVNEAPIFKTDEVDRADRAKEAGEKRALQQLNRIEDEFLKSTKNVTELARVEYDRQLELLNKNLDDKLISEGDYVKARAEMEASLTAKLAAEAQKQIQPISNAISGTLTRQFDTFLKDGTINFQAFTNMMVTELAKVAFQMAIIQPLFGGGTTPGGGAVGSLLAGVFHGGGTVGEGGGARAVPGLAFAMAPRFHSGGFPGLRSGEVPAILERGEQVIPKGGRGMGGGSRPIVINIQTPNPESFRSSQGQIAAMVTRAAQRGQRNM